MTFLSPAFTKLLPELLGHSSSQFCDVIHQSQSISKSTRNGDDCLLCGLGAD